MSTCRGILRRYNLELEGGGGGGGVNYHIVGINLRCTRMTKFRLKFLHSNRTAIFVRNISFFFFFKTITRNIFAYSVACFLSFLFSHFSSFCFHICFLYLYLAFSVFLPIWGGGEVTEHIVQTDHIILCFTVPFTIQSPLRELLDTEFGG